MRSDRGPHLLRAFPLVRQAPALLARRRESAVDATLVLGLRDPRDPGVRANDRVLRIHQENLEVLVSPVLSDPVRGEDLHVRIPPGDPFLGNPLDRLRHRDLDHPPAFWLPPALRVVLPETAPPHARADDDEPGLRLPAQ